MDKNELQARLIKTSNRFRKVKLDIIFGDLSKGELFMLEMIHNYKEKHNSVQGIYVSVLAEHLNVSSPAVSRMLRSLEEKGYIERNVDRHNRRNTYVYLTTAGDNARLRVGKSLENFMEKVITSMGDEQVYILLTKWDHLLDVLEEEIEKREKGEQQC